MFKFLKKARRRLTSFIVVILLFLGIVVVPMYMETIDSSLMISMHTDSAPKLIAHRGLSSLYPENTLPAFEGAAKYGFDGFEFDIHITKDGEWIVIHDEDVVHMTEFSGKVADYTLKELREMKLINGNHIEDYPDLVMPTLKETLDMCKNSNIIPVIELKGGDIQHLPSLKKTLDEYELSDKAVLISFFKEHLEEYRKLDSNIEILYLSNEPTKEDIDWCIENNAGINFNMWLLFKCFGAINYAGSNDVTIAAWTVDNTIFADIMVLFGAEYITTDKILP